MPFDEMSVENPHMFATWFYPSVLNGTLGIFQAKCPECESEKS